MQGTRVTSGKVRDFFGHPGAYGKVGDRWLICVPTGDIGGLDGHTITEHADGTITVSPSILIFPSADSPGWHGYLERGVWRAV
jgi:hypothetical protein